MANGDYSRPDSTVVVTSGSIKLWFNKEVFKPEQRPGGAIGYRHRGTDEERYYIQRVLVTRDGSPVPEDIPCEDGWKFQFISQIDGKGKRNCLTIESAALGLLISWPRGCFSKDAKGGFTCETGKLKVMNIIGRSPSAVPIDEPYTIHLLPGTPVISNVVTLSLRAWSSPKATVERRR